MDKNRLVGVLKVTAEELSAVGGILSEIENGVVRGQIEKLDAIATRLKACAELVLTSDPSINLLQFSDDSESESFALQHGKKHREDFTDATGDEVGQWLQETFTNAKKKKKPDDEQNLNEKDKRHLNGIVSPGGSLSVTSFLGNHDSPKASHCSLPTTQLLGAARTSQEDLGATHVDDSHLVSMRSGGEGPVEIRSEGTTESRRGSTEAPTSPTQREASAIASMYKRTVDKTTSKTVEGLKLERILSRLRVPLLDVDSPDFDIFAAVKKHGEPNLMTYVAANVFFRYKFVESLELDEKTMIEFFSAVESNYRPQNPYHNQLHAADVLQTTHVYLCVGDVKDNFDDCELLSVLFSALVHDVGHLGISNAFLIRTGHPLASLYNDSSPLESMHAALAFNILQEHNFFKTSSVWDETLNAAFRSRVVDIVVGTDMKFHATMINTVAEILADGQIDDEEVTYLFKSIVHAADLSNPMKPPHIYQNWLNRVVAEFWQQGDQEKERGLPISMMCDRRSFSIPKAQAGFITFIVKPFISELASLLPDVWVQRLEGNLAEMTSWDGEYDVKEIVSLASVPWQDSWDSTKLSRQMAPLVKVSRTEALRATLEVKLHQVFQDCLNELKKKLRPATEVTDEFSLAIFKALAEADLSESGLAISEAFPELLPRPRLGSDALSSHSGRSSRSASVQSPSPTGAGDGGGGEREDSPHNGSGAQFGRRHSMAALNRSHSSSSNQMLFGRDVKFVRPQRQVASDAAWYEGTVFGEEAAKNDLGGTATNLLGLVADESSPRSPKSLPSGSLRDIVRSLAHMWKLIALSTPGTSPAIPALPSSHAGPSRGGENPLSVTQLPLDLDGVLPPRSHTSMEFHHAEDGMVPRVGPGRKKVRRLPPLAAKPTVKPAPYSLGRRTIAPHF